MWQMSLIKSLICILLYINIVSTTELGADLLPSTDVCGIQRQNRIVGGKHTKRWEFPWMALLEYSTRGGRKLQCGGSLISNRYVLTAGHCLKNNLVSVRLGEHDIRTDPDCESPGFDCADPIKVVDVEEQIKHPQYNKKDRNQHGDIALLRLKEEVAFTTYITPICLPLADSLKSRAYTGMNLTVAGWGKTENTSYSDVKLKVEVPVLTDSSCSVYYSRHRVNVADSQLCAGGGKGEDSCRGDSGGPLMYHQNNTAIEDNWYAIGVVSFGPDKCGTENFPGIYVKVSSFLDWILDNLKP